MENVTKLQWRKARGTYDSIMIDTNILNMTVSPTIDQTMKKAGPTMRLLLYLWGRGELEQKIGD